MNDRYNLFGLTENCSDEEFENQREILLCLAREILKPEWERVKLEAKGK